MDTYNFIGNSAEIYRQMFKDIDSAKESIYLESFIFDPDEIGRKFRDAFIKKIKQGVKVKILLDWFGAKVNKSFFKELVAVGGEVRFARELRFTPKLFLRGHERDHRKLLIIDKDISYIGSINFSTDALKWRESVVRCTGGITKQFKKVFLELYLHYNNHFIRAKKFSKTIKYKEWDILKDVPSWRYQRIRKRLIYLLKKAKKEIIIEVPYFLPDLYLRLLMKKAVKRGVKVTLLLPHISDVRTVDVLRERFTGRLHKNGIEIYYYTDKILHSKVIVIDDTFIVGSLNVDARTFIHNYEIALLGKDKKIFSQIKEHYKDTKKGSKKFNYDEWKNRSIFLKILEAILAPFKQWM